MTILHLLVIASLLAWLYLFFAHGRFWWDAGESRRPGPEKAPTRPPIVTALVPARNEEETIARVLAGLLGQEGRFRLRILVIDDQSTDLTGPVARNALAEAAARGVKAQVVRGRPLAEGWSGKLWALEQGRRHPLARDADWLWLTDADVLHPPGTLARLLSIAAAERRELVSEMVRLDAAAGWARLLIPAFVYFFRLLYPFAWVRTGRRPAAAGGSILVARPALEKAGGFGAWRDALIDDCALARAVAAQGARLWLQLSPTSVSLRRYAGLRDVWNMVRRTAYTELGFSPVRLLATVVGMCWLMLAPPLWTLAAGVVGLKAAVAGACAWATMAVTFAPALAREGAPGWLAPLLPVAALLFLGMTIHSAFDHYTDRRGGWKGRHYARPVERTA